MHQIMIEMKVFYFISLERYGTIFSQNTLTCKRSFAERFHMFQCVTIDEHGCVASTEILQGFYRMPRADCVGDNRVVVP